MTSFSLRSHFARGSNALALRRDALIREGKALLDLSESNPTRCGFHFPSREIVQALSHSHMLGYAPNPRGHISARQAIAQYVAARGGQLSPEHILLTSGTSEAYAFLFKVLCDPGDNVLVACPGYPLLDYLAGFEGVEIRRFNQLFDGSWRLDVESVREAGDAHTKAVVVVHPGNPTGAFLKRSEHKQLLTLCAKKGWALIADEVFLDYGAGEDPDRVPTCLHKDPSALTFVLSGLSKVGGLPQLKLSWIAVAGPAGLRDEALERLEWISDNYLSVSTPVQLALPRLLELSVSVRGQIRDRVAKNRAMLALARTSHSRWSLLPSEGGWSAVLRIPTHPGEETTCLRLLDQGVCVQPGYFYDFPQGAHVVLSLLPELHTFQKALPILSETLDAVPTRT